MFSFYKDNTFENKVRIKAFSYEVIPIYKPGDVLLYRYDIWHRGTPVNVGHKRSVINIAWKKRDSFWHLTWNPAWSKRNYYGKVESVLIKLSPKQRALLGIPKPGHEYWNNENISWFGSRYPGLDTGPYFRALKP